MDVFSFGLVLFYCLTGGRHAFGESYERDFNIMQVRGSPGAQIHQCAGVSVRSRSRLSVELQRKVYNCSWVAAVPADR